LPKKQSTHSATYKFYHLLIIFYIFYKGRVTPHMSYPPTGHQDGKRVTKGITPRVGEYRKGRGGGNFNMGRSNTPHKLPLPFPKGKIRSSPHPLRGY
jgi:hypothetical protein